MNEHELMSAFSNLMDEKLDRLEQRMDARMDDKLDRLEQKMDVRMDEKLDRLEQKMDKRFVGLEQRMESVEGRLTRVEVDLLENNVIPKLNTIEGRYMSTYNRYQAYSERMEAAFTDIDLLKKVVSEHSEKLKKIS